MVPLDGRKLASADRKSVQVWEAETGILLLRYEGHRYTTVAVNAVAWSPDGQKLASASKQNGVQIREVGIGNLLLQYEGHAVRMSAVAWSPDGQKLASASKKFGTSVQIREMGTGKLLLQYVLTFGV